MSKVAQDVTCEEKNLEAKRCLFKKGKKTADIFNKFYHGREARKRSNQRCRKFGQLPTSWRVPPCERSESVPPSTIPRVPPSPESAPPLPIDERSKIDFERNKWKKSKKRFNKINNHTKATAQKQKLEKKQQLAKEFYNQKEEQHAENDPQGLKETSLVFDVRHWHLNSTENQTTLKQKIKTLFSDYSDQIQLFLGGKTLIC
jgi:hypothetical protein